MFHPSFITIILSLFDLPFLSEFASNLFNVMLYTHNPYFSLFPVVSSFISASLLVLYSFFFLVDTLFFLLFFLRFFHFLCQPLLFFLFFFQLLLRAFGNLCVSLTLFFNQRLCVVKFNSQISLSSLSFSFFLSFSHSFFLFSRSSHDVHPNTPNHATTPSLCPHPT